MAKEWVFNLGWQSRTSKPTSLRTGESDTLWLSSALRKHPASTSNPDQVPATARTDARLKREENLIIEVINASFFILLFLSERLDGRRS
jgi:hypothetical protein